MRRHLRALARDAAIATAVLAAVYLLGGRFGVELAAVPFYLLVVGIDLLEAVFGPFETLRPLVVAAYLAGLGLLGALGLRLGLVAAGRSERSSVRLGLAAPLAVIGAAAVALAAAAYVGTEQYEPVATAGGIGVACLFLSGLLGGLFDGFLWSDSAEPDPETEGDSGPGGL